MALRKYSDITSSMTSVTEEDVSFSESDTTETSCSQVSSSILSTTDPCIDEKNYNTDDKLTPSFNRFSISNYSNSCRRKLLKEDQIDSEWFADKPSEESRFSFALPFSAEYMPRNTNVSNRRKGYQQMTQRKKDISCHEQQCKQDKGSFPKGRSIQNDKWTYTMDSPDYNLYTDFCNQCYSHSAFSRVHTTQEEDEENSEEISSDDSERPYFPDMTSSSWYTAKVFDKYWSYHSFAMDWYNEHVKFVQAHELSAFNSMFNIPFPARNPSCVHKKSRMKDKKKKKKRARRRRAAKAGRKLNSESQEPGTNEDNEEEEEEEETIKMEITEDMINFFSQSYKHRLERDKLKEENGEEEVQRIDLEQAISGLEGPTTNAPVERPGVRRTAEMKLLYGKGAAMIHGMETALQMTYDKFVDIHQPKLWPNMPLKMNFK